MKRTLLVASVLLIMSCKDKPKNPGDDFIGKWTDGRVRHMAIKATKGGYIVEDISNGDKEYFAKYFENELIVNVDNGAVSVFNYAKGIDKLFAGKVIYHREPGSK